MSNYYKSCPIEISEYKSIIRDFEKGEYRPKKGNVTLRPEKLDTNNLNKYNKELLYKYKDLIEQFRELICVNSVLSKLIDNHKYEYAIAKDTVIVTKDNTLLPGVRGNLANVLRAQGQTVDVLNSIKEALKKYGITKKRILDALEDDIEKNYERSKRNKEFTIDIIENYGFSEISNILLKEKGRNLFDDAVYETNKAYADNKALRSKEGADIKGLYTLVNNNYVKYITDIINRYNINIEDYISESVQKEHDIRKKKKEEEKETDRDRKKLAKRKKDFGRCMHDNTVIFKDIERYFEYGERPSDLKLTKHLVSQLEQFGYCGLYIASPGRQYISYVNNKDKLDLDVLNIKIFPLDNIRQVDELINELEISNTTRNFFKMKLDIRLLVK